MTPPAVGTPDTAIVDTLSTLVYDFDREGLVLPAYTLAALVATVGRPESEVKAALVSLMIGGAVITRKHRPTGKTLYKLPDKFHGQWAELGRST